MGPSRCQLGLPKATSGPQKGPKMKSKSGPKSGPQKKTKKTDIGVSLTLAATAARLATNPPRPCGAVQIFRQNEHAASTGAHFSKPCETYPGVRVSIYRYSTSSDQRSVECSKRQAARASWHGARPDLHASRHRPRPLSFKLLASIVQLMGFWPFSSWLFGCPRSPKAKLK